MESKNAKPETLVMDDQIISQSKPQVVSVSSENSNPNVPHETPVRISGSPFAKSSESAEKVTRSKLNPSLAAFSPRNRIRERRFVVVKKKKKKKEDSASVECKCGAKNMKKCVCVAYETLRASHEDFFKKREVEIGESSLNVEEEEDETGDCSMKRRREKVLEEARRSLPEYGKVMHLVKAFEKLTCFPFAKATEDKKIKKALKWGLPGMMSLQQQQPKCPEETETDQVTWTSSFSPSDLVLTATNLGIEQPLASVSSSWGSNSVSSLSSNGGRRSRRNSLDSSASMGSRISKKKQVKVTSLKPFKLRTEERGRMKEEELAKKLQEMTMEEEKMRIPKAQGLPWTTDEPETLVKPYVKDITIPVELKLHSDIRAKERAEFDYQVKDLAMKVEQAPDDTSRSQVSQNSTQEMLQYIVLE
ncbi:TPX2 (targeting protein for Xklp2) protein family [Raphanus sativus]|nr:TPX2 (targeting protein for Xklp2) protein family [Raphanus sativus]